MEKMAKKNDQARWKWEDWLSAAGLILFFVLILVLTALAAICTSQYLKFTTWN